jgi:hypothetical protein
MLFPPACSSPLITEDLPGSWAGQYMTFNDKSLNVESRKVESFNAKSLNVKTFNAENQKT